MPRVYTSKSSKPYKKYDPLILNSAILAYQTGNRSIVEVAKQFNISKSVLHRHATRTMKCQGGQKALTDEVEKYIIKYINVCSEWGYPLDTYDLRIIIKGYLDRMGLTIKKFKNNLPGVAFTESFLKRHNKDISERVSQNIKRSRAAVSPEIIEQYFEELERSLQGVDLANIVNYDESNLADDPGKKKVLTKRGAKYPERVMNHTKSSTSLMMAVAADGTLLPCYVVYKAAHLYNTWTTNGPPNCRYNRTNSGWFDGDTFEDWVETVAIPYFNNKIGKKILIGDNLSSHLSIELIRKCQELDINFVFLPPNSTHLTQPLDVAFFRPAKIAWRDILFTWKKTEGRILPTIPKNVFPKLLKKMLDKMEPNIKQNILSGFAKAGISPLNKEKVLNRLPGHVTRNEFGAEEKEAIDESVLNLLKEMRYGPQNSRPINKMKKLNVKPGRSVEDSTGYIDSEISNSEITPQPNISRKGKGIGKKSKKDSSNNIIEVKKTEESVKIDKMTIIMDNEIPIIEDKVIYTDLNTYDEERMSDNTIQEQKIESVIEINLLHEDKVLSLTGHDTRNGFGATEREAIHEPVLTLQKDSYGSKNSRSGEMNKLNVKAGRGAEDRTKISRKGKGIGKKSRKENVSNNIIVAKTSEESFEIDKMPIIMADEIPIMDGNVIYNDLTTFDEEKVFDEQISNNETVNTINLTDFEEKENKIVKGKGKCKEETTKKQDELIRYNEMMNIPEKKVTDLNVKKYFDYLEEDILKMPVILEEAMLCGDEVVIDYGIDKETGNDEIPKEDDIVSSRYNLKEPKKERRESKVKIIANEDFNDSTLMKNTRIKQCKKITPNSLVTVSDNTINYNKPRTSCVRTISSRRPSYYRNDDEILRDLMDDNI